MDGNQSSGPAIPGDTDDDDADIEEIAENWDWMQEDSWPWGKPTPCRHLIPDWERSNAKDTGGLRSAAKMQTEEGEPVSPQEHWYRNRWEDLTEGIHTSTILCGDKTVGACSVGNPCSPVPPCDTPKSISDFWALDFDLGLKIFKLKWDSKTTDDDYYWEHTLWQAAIAVLLDNLDVIHWIEQRVANESRLATFLGQVYRRKSGFKTVTIKMCGDGGRAGCKKGVWSFESKQLITFEQENVWWRVYCDAWKKPTSTPSDIDRLSIALDLAGTLLHELVHITGYDQADGDVQGGCFISYLIENMFRWAIYTRYPDAQGSRCFAFNSLSIDPLWGFDWSVWPSNRCIGSTTNYDLTPYFTIHLPHA
ncbi:MAG TPA: hypothetical protein PLA94_16940 [Myxococcota bacterium]|nr:hypothetical protein [Myxococcota bacterium]